MLRTLAKGLLGRVLAYGAFALGFWLLYRGFMESSVPLGILGGGLILVAMYLLVTLWRTGPARRNPDSDRPEDDSE